MELELRLTAMLPCPRPVRSRVVTFLETFERLGDLDDAVARRHLRDVLLAGVHAADEQVRRLQVAVDHHRPAAH